MWWDLTGDAWLKAIAEWAASQGLGMCYFNLRDRKEWPCLTNHYVIVAGTTPRSAEYFHAVVALAKWEGAETRLEYIHDPYPDGEYITDPDHCLFFVPPNAKSERENDMKKTTKPVHESPDNFLSHHGNPGHGIDYSGSGLQGSPAEIVANLKALNATRALDESGALVVTVYHTPGFKSTPQSAASTSPDNVATENKLVAAYNEALKTGNLAKVHKAVDWVNKQRMAMGGIQELVPPSDFAILAEADNALGKAAKYLNAERVAFAETGEASLAGSPIPWFDTPEAFKALSDY